MMQPKSFFFGMIIIPMYYYSCVMTNAQLDLIVSDKPVSYTKPEKKKFGKPSKKQIDETIRKFNERQSKNQ